MDTPSLQIAALLCSRLCHDLISPVGAIANGIEVMRDETDVEMRTHAMALIEASAQQASARLQYARLAFGVAGSVGAEVDLGEAERLAAQLLERGKIELVWRLPARSAPKERVKILLNVVLVAIDCIPRGGRLTVAGSAAPDAGLRITAAGTKARLAPDIRAAIQGETPLDALDSRQVQPGFTHLLLRAEGALLEIAEGEAEVSLSVSYPSGGL